jgi:hypothetical protein
MIEEMQKQISCKNAPSDENQVQPPHQKLTQLPSHLVGDIKEAAALGELSFGFKFLLLKYSCVINIAPMAE